MPLYQKKRITIFHAGAGFGKTLFMVNLVQQEKAACAWYQVDAGDNDPVLFLQTLSDSLSEALGTQDNTVFPEDAEEQAEKEGYYFQSLIRQMTENLDRDIVVVLDDFQEICQNTMTGLLKRLLDNAPENVRFVLAVKGVFPAFLASYLVKELAGIFRQEQLAFSREETEELLFRIAGVEQDAATVEKVMEYTEGWPAGVMFAALGFLDCKECRDVRTVFRSSQMNDYIAYEVFRKLPFTLQQFLVDTSVLDSLSPAVCDAVTEEKDSYNSLEYLVQESMFVIRLDAEERWYRYHSIFKDFLNSRIRESRKMEIYQKAALFYMKKRNYETGVEYAIRCGDWETVELGLRLDGERLFAQGRMSTIKNWVCFLEQEGHALTEECRSLLEQLYITEERSGKGGERKRIRVTCFGGFWAETEEGNLIQWRTRKTMELFACLFNAQGRGLNKDVLMEQLWPGADPQKSSGLLNTTVSYLRRSLKGANCPGILLVEQKKYRLALELLDTDYGIFLELAEKIENGRWSELTYEEAQMPVYRGRYMEGEDFPWAIERQEYLEQTYLKCLKIVTDYYNRLGDWEKGVQTARRALETDPFFEEMAKVLIRGLKRLGKPAEAKRQMEKYNRLWLEEIGQEFYNGEDI